MSGRVRTLVHAGMAAAALAVIGAMYAELAGMYVAARPVNREGPLPGGPPPDVGAMLRWRVPLGMAAFGFVFVVLGEALAGAWKKPAPKPAAPPPRNFDQEAEAAVQKILNENEGKPS